MRIAIVIDNLKMGGAQKLVTTFISAASIQQIKLTVVSLHADLESPILDSIQSSGVAVAMFPARSLLDLGRLGRLIRFFRREKFDVIHAHLEYAIILGAFAGALSGAPVVASLHNTRYHRWPSLEKLVLNYIVKHIIAVGPAVVEAYKLDITRRQIEVMANPVLPIAPVSVEERHAVRTEIAGDASRPLIISVGRLEPQKGFIDLIAAMEIVHRAYPQACLAIAGTGKLLSELQDQINLCHLQGCIRLLGLRNDIPRLLASSDIFAMPSHWEGMPVAVLEAMSAGLPVVATSVGDVPHIVSKEGGRLVLPHQPEALATALIALLNDPIQARQLGLVSRSYVLDQHATKLWVDRLLAIYGNILNAK